MDTVDLPTTLQAIARVSSHMPVEHCRAVDEAATEITRLRERVDELLEANNRFEQRARDAYKDNAELAKRIGVTHSQWYAASLREVELRVMLGNFYDHVTTNAMLWVPGTDDVTHNHPIWPKIKKLLGRT